MQTLPIDPTAATITLQAEALLKGDLQNIMGGLPYGSGGATRAGASTRRRRPAISIITSIAQRIIQARKQHYLWAYAKLGQALPPALPAVPPRRPRRQDHRASTARTVWRQITPLEIQGDFDVTIDVTSDSLLRQERRAEAQALLQLLAGTQQIAAMSGTPLNLQGLRSRPCSTPST